MKTNNPYFDRDLSWLSFNHRVLEEATDIELPLYDRIKFLSIYSSNLDEFYRVRIADIRRIIEIDKKKINKKLGQDPRQLLDQIRQKVSNQQNEFGSIFQNSIMPALKIQGVYLYQDEPILPGHESLIYNYFRSRVLSYLQPIIMSAPGSRSPFLENGALYFAIQLTSKGSETDSEPIMAHLNIPSHQLPRFLPLPEAKGKHYFIFLDDVIRRNLHLVFPGYEVKGCYSIKLNRDADLYIDDEYTGDLVKKIKKQLKNRNIGPASRFLYDSDIPEDFLGYLVNTFDLDQEDLIPGGRYHNLNDLISLPNPLKTPNPLKFEPIIKKDLETDKSIFESIIQKDLILHFPYHSYDYTLRFFNEAAIDPFVTEIKATFYRLAAESLIVNALISAARNGKKVTVFVEVKARFDEENNLKWAGKMKEAGIRIIYSIPGLKVHAKVALIKRKNNKGKKTLFAFLGTGNFNERTARIYADHGLFTANKLLTKELDQVFKHLKNPKKTPEFKTLLVSQFNLQERLIQMIEREISWVQQGKEGYMLVKVNNLEDRIMIDKLYQASQEGVKINLLVRGICCLVPGIPQLSENIRVFRLVDHFLEHARIFLFNNHDDPELYLSSADWMKRNLYSRIEVGFPILDPEVKSEIMKLLELQLNDNTKARILDGELNNQVIKSSNGPAKIRAQLDFYQWLKDKS
ncbi:MAG: polyphosphate kinase 1 [Candidatus Cyclobacteriaceae bacterium M3_2C_046]